MDELPRVGDLQIDQDLQFEQRNWRVQRVGWLVMALFVTAGLLGLFGRGVLSRAIVGTPQDVLWMEYERLTRYASRAVLQVRLNPAAVHDGRARVSIGSEYIDGIDVVQISLRLSRWHSSTGQQSPCSRPWWRR